MFRLCCIGLVICLVLGGCAGESNPDTPALIDVVTPDLPEVSPTESSPPTPDTAEEKQGQPWQIAYAELLREYEQLAVDQFDAHYIEGYLDTYIIGSFFLYDFNKNGVPELVILEHYQSLFFRSHAVYTFSDGSAIPLNGGFHSRGSSVFVPSDNRPGLILTSVESGYCNYHYIVMEGYNLVADISAFEDWTPKQDGFDFSLYFIKGADVTPFDIRQCEKRKDWHSENFRETISFGYVSVTENEYNRVFNDVFHNLDEGISLIFHAINESNIQSTIYNYQP